MRALPISVGREQFYMSDFVNLICFSSVGITVISAITLFVSDCGRPAPRIFLIALLDRYPFVASKFSTGAWCLLPAE